MIKLIKIINTTTNEETLVLTDTALVDDIVSSIHFNIIDAHRNGDSVSKRVKDLVAYVPECEIITPYTVIKYEDSY